MTAIIIHGLRRSGTTILWEMFRSNPQIRCFDEPLHPGLLDGNRTNHKGTWNEISEVLDLPDAQPAVIMPMDELDPISTRQQRAWLGKLCHDNDRVVMDIVRGWNKLPDLHASCGQVLALHIIREPIGWITAHLMPKGQKRLRGRLIDQYRRHSFFRRRGFYDGYQYETIINAACACDHPVLQYVKPSASELARAPAFIKLLAFWWGANVTIRRAYHVSGDPYHAITLGEFSAAPDQVLATASATAGWRGLAYETSSVRPVPAGFQAQSERWKQAAIYLGIPPDILLPRGQTATKLEAAFDAARPMRKGGTA